MYPTCIKKSIKGKTKLHCKLLRMGVGNRREHIGIFWSAYKYNFLFLNRGGHYIDICSVISYCTALYVCSFFCYTLSILYFKTKNVWKKMSQNHAAFCFLGAVGLYNFQKFYNDMAYSPIYSSIVIIMYVLWGRVVGRAEEKTKTI